MINLILEMDLSSKVLTLPNICGLEIDVTGATTTPANSSSLQPFYDTIVQNSSASKSYFTPGKISFSEESTITRAGYTFKQTLSFSFPSSDPLRVGRISEYLKAKYIYVKLSEDMVFFFGRNDWNQNSLPKASVKSNEKLTQISYTLQSIFSIGFAKEYLNISIPQAFPLNFYNL